MFKWIRKVLLLIAILGLIFSGVKLANEVYKPYHSNKIAKEINEEVVIDNSEYFEVDWNAVKNQCPQYVGWIYIPQLSISYPVVQTTDNFFYTSHASNMVYDNYGAIFMDASCESDMSLDNTIIYGHSVTYFGGMFSNLKNLTDLNTFNNVDTFYYLTPTQNYKCSTFCFAPTVTHSVFYDFDFSNVVTYEWDEEESRKVAVSNEREKEEVFEKMKEKALYYNDLDIGEDTKLISLSTCNLNYGLNSKHRYVLNAKIEPYDEKIKVN